MSQYCSRYMDDAPSIRADCEHHIAAGRKCEDCQHRDVRNEVKHLRAANAQLRRTLKTHLTPEQKGDA